VPLKSEQNRVKKVAAGDARGNLADVINEVAYGAIRIVLTRRGKGVAAVVPIIDLEFLQEIERLIDVDRARKALVEAKKTGTLDLEDLKKELGLR